MTASRSRFHFLTAPALVSLMFPLEHVVTLPTSRPNGLVSRACAVLRNSDVELDCLYGIDGATNQLAGSVADPRRPGCTATLCDISQLCLRGNLSDGCQHGRAMCGFIGEPSTGFNGV